MGFVKYRTVRSPVGRLGFSAERGATFALVHAVVNYKIDQFSYNFNIGSVCATLAHVRFYGPDGNGDPDSGRKIERSPTSRDFRQYRPAKRSVFQPNPADRLGVSRVKSHLICGSGMAKKCRPRSGRLNVPIRTASGLAIFKLVCNVCGDVPYPMRLIVKVRMGQQQCIHRSFSQLGHGDLAYGVSSCIDVCLHPRLDVPYLYRFEGGF
jgi:hypothetical protein